MYSARKTVSGAGRPRKSGPRQPNGRLVQPTKTQTEAEVVELALWQPHRQGNRDQRLQSLIGRLVLGNALAIPPIPAAVVVDGLTADQLYDLAEKFQRDYQRCQAALASRRPLAVTGGGVQRPDPDPVREQKAIETWAGVSRALRVHGDRVEKAMQFLIIDAAPDYDQRVVAPWIILSAPLGFRALAEWYS